MQIVMDVLMPFAFLTLSLFGAAFGWAFRVRYLHKPPSGLYVFVPVVAFVVAILSLLWIYAHRVLLGFVVLSGSFTAALVVCAVLEMVLLAVSLVVLAGQSAA